MSKQDQDVSDSLIREQNNRRDLHSGDPRARQLARIATLFQTTLLLAVGGLALWLLRDVVLVVFAAALFGVMLHGISNVLSRATRLPYGLSLALVTVLLVVLVGGLGVYAGPSLAEEGVQLKQKMSAQAVQLRADMSGSEWGRFVLQQLPGFLGGNASSEGSGSVPAGLAGSVAGFFESVFGALGTVVVILIAGLYFAISPRLYVDGALRLLPRPARGKGLRLVMAVGEALWHWTAGQAVDMLVVGILSGVGLALLGVPLALILGVLAGAMNFVPYIGAIVGSIPAILIALSMGPDRALSVCVLYAVIQAFEGNILAPLIQRRSVNLPPALSILSQTTIGALFGLPGLVLATPIAAALVAIAQVVEPPDDEAEDERLASLEQANVAA